MLMNYSLQTDIEPQIFAVVKLPKSTAESIILK